MQQLVVETYAVSIISLLDQSYDSNALTFVPVFSSFSMCGVEHLERADPEPNHMDLFEAMYFTVVTFSTVGYGDLKVDIWPSRLFIMIMIGVALKQVPLQVSLCYLKLCASLFSHQK